MTIKMLHWSSLRLSNADESHGWLESTGIYRQTESQWLIYSHPSLRDEYDEYDEYEH